jgi:uncharacterized membrane protein
MGYRHGGFFNGFGAHGPGVVGIFLMIVFWVLVALVIMAVVRTMRHGPHHLHNHGYAHWHGAAPVDGPVATSRVAHPAIDLLKERFAKGEVSEEEFTRRLALLKES